eukprot:scaffold159694_cov18-Tisochrysis_lutea.AAC.1
MLAPASATQELDILNLNYNSDSDSVAQGLLTIVEDGPLSVTCKDCFSTMTAGIDFSMSVTGVDSFPFAEIEALQLSFFGDTEINIDLEGRVGVAAAKSIPE